MKNQNYENHTRYYPFHHFVLTPLTLLFLGWTVKKMDFSSQGTTLESLYLFIGAFILFLLPLIARMYALKIQNRIILNEMRNRYFHLTEKGFEEKEKELKLGQIIGLRFASDTELLTLMERAITENLSSKEIKQQIKDWKGDYLRV
ncbi:MAG: DUF6526 family protein [Bacteroidetes bacterium]|nr:DUF6526 family protein [Bacteroidota bacterium]